MKVVFGVVPRCFSISLLWSGSSQTETRVAPASKRRLACRLLRSAFVDIPRASHSKRLAIRFVFVPTRIADVNRSPLHVNFIDFAQ